MKNVRFEAKNDFCFAFVMVAVFVVSVVALVGESVDAVRGSASASAKVQVAPLALSEAQRAPQAARAGPQ